MHLDMLLISSIVTPGLRHDCEREYTWSKSRLGKRIRLLSVDGHPLFREGIAAMINSQQDMALVAQASGGKEAIQKDIGSTCRTLRSWRLGYLIWAALTQ